MVYAYNGIVALKINPATMGARNTSKGRPWSPLIGDIVYLYCVVPRPWLATYPDIGLIHEIFVCLLSF